METQRGFTLIELMVVISIIAILSAIGIPAYQRYIQKAAMTDMLQAMVPYKMAVELCALEGGGPSGCDAGSKGIPCRGDNTLRQQYQGHRGNHQPGRHTKPARPDGDAGSHNGLHRPHALDTPMQQ